MTIAARRELAHNVGARLGRQSDACRGSATSGGQRSLCEGACGGISGDAPRGGRAFAVLCVARDHGAGQGMRQSRRDAVLGGAVVVQIFMQPRPLLCAPRWSSPRWSQTRRPGVCRNRRRRRHTSAASCVPAQLRRRPLRVPARPSRRWHASSACDRDDSSLRRPPRFRRATASAAQVREQPAHCGASQSGGPKPLASAKWYVRPDTIVSLLTSGQKLGPYELAADVLAG
jgi:hypothetical protein